MSISSKIKRFALSFLIFLFGCKLLYGGQVLVYQGSGGAGPANAEYGYTTIGGTSISRDNYRRIEIIPDDDIDVTYGYFYGYDDNSDGYEEMQLGIYNAAGALQGSCSNLVTINSGTPQWWEFTWETPVSLTGSTTYYLQYHTTTLGYVTYYYDETGSNNRYGQASCGTMYLNSSARKNTMSIANYQAH